MKGVRSNGGTFERNEGFIAIDLDQADEGVSTSAEKTVLDNTVKEGLHDGCFESGDSSFAEDCGHGVSENEEM